MEGNQIGTVNASPTKSFFVQMLTRDIDLEDALLDLLDNCVDGILRSRRPDDKESTPYEGCSAEIIMAPDFFSIEDNCGGIPIEVARKYAFAMGRPPGAGDGDQPATVGMYGIGMKRAIFKLGMNALVESYNDEAFVVEFSPEWMAEDTWKNLPMFELPPGQLNEGKTKIRVSQLNVEAASSFADTQWIDDFRKVVAKHYSIIIDKGFKVTIGSPDEIAAGVDPVLPEEFKLLRTKPYNGREIAPYVYTGSLGDVSVEIYAGIYRELLSAEEVETEEDTRGSSDDAGWTIACNDRVIVWKDKTRLTGWGEYDVPSYHGQFIAITGIVLLRSADPSLLPLTTTKHGIDGSSILYSEVKDLMREATKSLTSFTNRWKRFPKDLDRLYQGAWYVSLGSLRAWAPELATNAGRKLPSIKKYEPAYPEPLQQVTSARVVFVADKDELAKVAEHFFGDEKVKPGAVGEAAFRDVVGRIEENPT